MFLHGKLNLAIHWHGVKERKHTNIWLFRVICFSISVFVCFFLKLWIHFSVMFCKKHSLCCLFCLNTVFYRCEKSHDTNFMQLSCVYVHVISLPCSRETAGTNICISSSYSLIWNRRILYIYIYLSYMMLQVSSCDLFIFSWLLVRCSEIEALVHLL